MADGCLDNDAFGSLIPVDQIVATRAAFPKSYLTFEIDLHATDPWSGLACIAEAFGRSGLAPISLRCTAEGAVACRVIDSPECNFNALHQILHNPGKVRIVKWTTVIGF